MSKEAIEKIRETEAEAAAIKRGVAAKVKALLDTEERKGILLKETAETKSKAERSRILDEAEKKAAAIMVDGNNKSEAEAAEIRAKAEKNLPDAVKIIMKGVDAMCR